MPQSPIRPIVNKSSMVNRHSQMDSGEPPDGRRRILLPENLAACRRTVRSAIRPHSSRELSGSLSEWSRGVARGRAAPCSASSSCSRQSHWRCRRRGRRPCLRARHRLGSGSVWRRHSSSRLDYRLFSLSVSAEDLTIADAATPQQPVLHAARLDVDLAGSALGGRLAFDGIAARDVRLAIDTTARQPRRGDEAQARPAHCPRSPSIASIWSTSISSSPTTTSASTRATLRLHWPASAAPTSCRARSPPPAASRFRSTLTPSA